MNQLNLLFSLNKILYKRFINLIVFYKQCIPIKGGTLPYEVDYEVGGAVDGRARPRLQLQPDVVAEVVRHFDHVAHARPRLVHLSHVSGIHTYNLGNLPVLRYIPPSVTTRICQGLPPSPSGFNVVTYIWFYNISLETER